MAPLPIDAPAHKIALVLQTRLIDNDVVGDADISMRGSANDVFVVLREKEMRIRGAGGRPIYIAVRPVGGEFGPEYNPKTPEGAVGLGSLLLR